MSFHSKLPFSSPSNCNSQIVSLKGVHCCPFCLLATDQLLATMIGYNVYGKNFSKRSRMRMWKIGDVPIALNSPGWVSGSAAQQIVWQLACSKSHYALTFVLYETRQDGAKFLWPLTYWPFPHFHLGFIIANFILYLVAPSVHCIISFICLMTRHSKRILALNYALFFNFSKYFSIYIFLRIRARIN